MRDLYKKYLFAKGYFVEYPENSIDATFGALMGLAKQFNIVIRGNHGDLAGLDMIRLAEQELGQNVPAPFYRGFPQSVKNLSRDQLLYDQLYSYAVTYGLGNFDEAMHSVLEEGIQRTMLDEKTDVKYFEILTTEEAYNKLREMASDLLASTRPLSESQYELVKTAINDGLFLESGIEIASKNTVIKLFLDTENYGLIKFLQLRDVIKLVEELNYARYNNKNIKKLNLKNRDRILIKTVMNILFRNLRSGYVDIEFGVCEEKRKFWLGLLHHIHFQPTTPLQKRFVNCMHSEKNTSVMHYVEDYLRQGMVIQAADTLGNNKGSTAVLRNLNYLLGKCRNQKEADVILDNAFSTNNAIALIQLLFHYASYDTNDKGARTFKFTKFNMLRTHTETSFERAHRKTFLTDDSIVKIQSYIKRRLAELFKNQLGKVYIAPEMKNVSVPLQETTSNNGYGVLPKGTRVHLDGRTVRLFTYWEKVHDIDLSAIGIMEDGTQTEFSWRTMYGRQSDAVAFSGDCTSGYNGGSEYIDLNLDKIRQMYPKMKYIIVCNNVYTGIPFDKCICRAGYMLRQNVNSGEVFEPKTVKSSFSVTGNSTFSYMFAIDIDKNDFVWLNAIRDSSARVAGATKLDFLIPYINMCNVFSVYDLFTMLAHKVVDSPDKADVIVSDTFSPLDMLDEQELIRGNDTERMLFFMNNHN